MNTPATPTAPTKLSVQIQYRTAGKIHAALTSDASLRVGEQVLVEEERGTAVGTVVKLPGVGSDTIQPHKRVLHRATADELDQAAGKREKELAYLTFSSERVRAYQLNMKLVDCELVEGGSKALFIFNAEERIDFRSLVRELSNQFHVRIEMRQVGARDETKYKGCLGACGQVTTCCSTFLREFKPISIGMAKAQGLSPNPSKLTGLCGKLKCCLQYENSQYLEARKGLAKIGALVSTPRGTGKIATVDILKREYFIRLDEGGGDRFPAELCRPLDTEQRAAREKILAEKQEVSLRREEERRSRHERREKAVARHHASNAKDKQ